jgi:hypothetical protein
MWARLFKVAVSLSDTRIGLAMIDDYRIVGRAEDQAINRKDEDTVSSVLAAS